VGFDLIAAIDWTYLASLTQTILKVAAGLGFVIFVHELGHFLVAKACGVKCEKFYIGFDIPMPFGIPSKICKFQWGETEYGVGILPLGGYVKMLGQDDNPMKAEEEAERTKVRGSEGETPVAAPPTISSDAPEPSLADQHYELDPRSYTAKAVWQRMLIISAGVIMNLIFAVIFAAFAYQMGVPYTPCEIGHVLPGGPAWKAGIEPGTRLVQIDEDGKKRETLRFDFDLRQSVATHGDKSDLMLLFRDREGTETWKHVRPFTVRYWLESSSTIGISPAQTNKLNKDLPVIPHTAAAAAAPVLKGSDVVTAVDGTSIADTYQLNEVLAAQPDKPIKVRVERNAAPKGQPAQTTTVEVDVPARRLQGFGLVMHHGPITGIRPNSPAAKAGFKEGDLILSINQRPIDDPLLLPEVMRPLQGQEIEISVKRAGVEQPVAIRVTPTVPREFDYMLMPGCSMASEALGLAYEVTRRVKAVVPDSPAARAGLRPDDVLSGLLVRWEKATKDKAEHLRHDKPLELDDRQYTWAIAFHDLQSLVPGEIVDFNYVREGKTSTASLKPIEIAGFNPDRGFVFESRRDICRAQSWSEASFLGARQTWEDAFRVVAVLKKLVTGQVPIANLGGIGSIAYVAGKETEEGTSRLLIFLTMLSANLAVLNFMPIPALDGGHMMFLLYEGIFRKPVNERLQFALTVAGVACLLGLMIFVNAMDITRFLF
jgi:regulator of sigma E protease